MTILGLNNDKRLNTHEILERDEEFVRGSDRGFGFVMAVVFAAVALWPWVFGGGGVRIWAGAITAAFLTIALLAPAVLAF